jgi:hypothetical protein
VTSELVEAYATSADASNCPAQVLRESDHNDVILPPPAQGIRKNAGHMGAPRTMNPVHEPAHQAEGILLGLLGDHLDRQIATRLRRPDRQLIKQHPV